MGRVQVLKMMIIKKHNNGELCWKGKVTNERLLQFLWRRYKFKILDSEDRDITEKTLLNRIPKMIELLNLEPNVAMEILITETIKRGGMKWQ